eukprot:1174749-Pleurochrysis_carterae.AAC.2
MQRCCGACPRAPASCIRASPASRAAPARADTHRLVSTRGHGALSGVQGFASVASAEGRIDTRERTRRVDSQTHTPALLFRGTSARAPGRDRRADRSGVGAPAAEAQRRAVYRRNSKLAIDEAGRTNVHACPIRPHVSQLVLNR